MIGRMLKPGPTPQPDAAHRAKVVSVRSAFLAHIVFARPLHLDEFFAVLDGLRNALPPAGAHNVLGNPFDDPFDKEASAAPRGLLMLPMRGTDPAEVRQEIVDAVGDIPLSEIRLTRIETGRRWLS